LASHREKEDLISIGAYKSGSDPSLDAAIALRPQIDAFLRQGVNEHSDLEQTDSLLLALGRALEDHAAGVVVDGAAAGVLVPTAPAGSALPAVPVGTPGGAPVAIPSLLLG
jgi:flagellum-specific ATP synthase